MSDGAYPYKLYRNGRLFFIARSVDDVTRKLKGMHLRRDLGGVTVQDADGVELTAQEVLGIE